jgi:hypothetical protein
MLTLRHRQELKEVVTFRPVLHALLFLMASLSKLAELSVAEGEDQRGGSSVVVCMDKLGPLNLFSVPASTGRS